MKGCARAARQHRDAGRHRWKRLLRSLFEPTQTAKLGAKPAKRRLTRPRSHRRDGSNPELGSALRCPVNERAVDLDGITDGNR